MKKNHFLMNKYIIFLGKFWNSFSFLFTGETQSHADYVQLLDEAVNRVQSSSSQRNQNKNSSKY